MTVKTQVTMLHTHTGRLVGWRMEDILGLITKSCLKTKIVWALLPHVQNSTVNKEVTDSLPVFYAAVTF